MDLIDGKINRKGEESFQPGSGLPMKLAAPARRALANAGYTRLEQLALVSEDEVKKLNGIGAHALILLTHALYDKGLSFKNNQ
jgi:hypothetical protein